MVTLQEKERLITEHLAVQRVLNNLQVKKECPSCEYWSGSCSKFNAIPPQDVQDVGCDNWEEVDCIPFSLFFAIFMYSVYSLSITSVI